MSVFFFREMVAIPGRSREGQIERKVERTIPGKVA